MGGVDEVVRKAKTYHTDGDLRFAATLLDHAVFADSEHAGASTLYADTLEQLGYGAENGTWRNFFLSGATELREGNFGTPTATSAPAIVAQLTAEQLFDSLAISVDGPKAWDLDLRINVTFTDLDANYRVALRHGVLISRKKALDPDAAVTVSLSKARLLALLAGDADSPGVETSGDAAVLPQLLGVLQSGDPAFNIVTP
jgi:alkyl sulfatase BDS1-like metallo-beta-lactamase superfamily hydrolase